MDGLFLERSPLFIANILSGIERGDPFYLHPPPLILFLPFLIGGVLDCSLALIDGVRI